MLQGIAAAHPLGDLHIYFLGWARLLALLYTWLPAVPWYDMLHVGCLYAALAAIFYVLLAVLPAGRPGWYAVAIGSILFVATYALHLLQINFTRPALLLGGAAAGLLALPVATRRELIIRWLLAGVLFIAGWGIRPVAAELGLLLLVPVWLLRPARQWGAALLFALVLGGALTLGTELSATPAEKQYVKLNTIRTKAFDYKHYVFSLRTPTDKLAYATLPLGSGPYDSTLVNDEFLHCCLRQATPLAPAVRLRKWKQDATVQWYKWQKLAMVLLLAQWAAVGWAAWQGRLRGYGRCLWLFVAYQAFFWVVYLGIGVYFKPVARVAEPMITVFLLGNFVFLFELGRLTLWELPLRAGWVALAGLALLPTVRHEFRLVQTGHILEQQHANYLAQLTSRTSNTILVEGGLYEELDDLNLFNSYNLPHYQRILSLGGWSTYDPSRPALYRYLTGQADVAAALLSLGHRTDVTWVLKPPFATQLERYLNARCHLPAGTAIALVPAAGPHLPGSPQLYTFREIQVAGAVQIAPVNR